MTSTAHDRWSNEIRNYSVPHLRLRVMATLIRQMHPSAYADLGCAQGFLSKLAPASRYIGLDFVRPEHTPDFEFYQCNLNADPLPPVLGDVDLIACSGILEYVEDLPRLFG